MKMYSAVFLIFGLSITIAGTSYASDAFDPKSSTFGFTSTLKTKTSPWYKKILFIAAVNHDREKFGEEYSENYQGVDAGVTYSDNYSYKTDLTSNTSALSLSAGGEFFSGTSIFLSLTRQKPETSGDIKYSSDLTTNGITDSYSDTMSIKGNGDSTRLDFSLTHQATPFIGLGFDLYREDYKEEYSYTYSDKLGTYFSDSYAFSGKTTGHNVFAHVEKAINKTNLGITYSISSNEFCEDGFSEVFIRDEKRITAIVDHQWGYSLTTYASYNINSISEHWQTWTDTDVRTKVRSFSIGGKYMVTNNILLSFDYERFLKYEYLEFGEQDFDFDAISVKLKYNFSGKESKRRMRKNRLIGAKTASRNKLYRLIQQEH